MSIECRELTSSCRCRPPERDVLPPHPRNAQSLWRGAASTKPAPGSEANPPPPAHRRDKWLKPKHRTKAATPTAPVRSSRTRAVKKQTFVVSHLREAEFLAGLRPYADYRDLGIAKATDGLAQAHVIRFKPLFKPEEASTPHYHVVDFQMIYVLKGWYRSTFEGEGAHTFEAGSCWMQPPGIKPSVLGYSDDCELLEIVLPADFKTVTVKSLWALGGRPCRVPVGSTELTSRVEIRPTSPSGGYRF